MNVVRRGLGVGEGRWKTSVLKITMSKKGSPLHQPYLQERLLTYSINNLKANYNLQICFPY